jgi:hypothetical protein
MHAQKLGPALPVDHPAWQAALRAPVQPETDAERDAVAVAMRSGESVSSVEVSAEIARRSLG